MASSLSRTLHRSLFSNPYTKLYTTTKFNLSSLSYCTNSSKNASNLEQNVSDSPIDSVPDSVPEVEGFKRPAHVEYPIEKGLDYGIYKVHILLFCYISRSLRKTHFNVKTMRKIFLTITHL